MSIHSDHPFLPAADDRDPLRQMRGRLPSPVTVWATGSGRAASGLTVSSVLLANGEPSHVLGLIDADSDFWVSGPQTVVVNILGPEHRYLADAFAGTAPAAGGPFTLGTWNDTEWGPALDDSAGWIGIRLVEEEPRTIGWGLLVDGVVEHVELGAAEALIHLRGRYRTAD